MAVGTWKARIYRIPFSFIYQEARLKDGANLFEGTESATLKEDFEISTTTFSINSECVLDWTAGSFGFIYDPGIAFYRHLHPIFRCLHWAST